MEGKKPRCFESEDQWDEFQMLWALSNRGTKPNMCHDCTPEWRNQMIRADRCAHPETVFVMNDGEVVGVNGSKWFTWISALTGKHGPVVSQPDRITRNRFIAEKQAEAKAIGKYLLTPEQRAKQKR